ncbi:hypothetical protein FZW96_06300 [Bacillus sp. BGMRC 2118]|nr:hypothetical protein FZW96_06300 [Bacillus sp. BGMRC 2118]
MRNVVEYIFITLLTAFLFMFVFLKNAHYMSFLFYNTLIEIILVLLALFVLFFVSVWLHKQLSLLQYSFPIEMITSLLLILFFTYSLFASHFYSDSYLRESGLEKITRYQQLNNPKYSETERNELLEEVMVKEWASAHILVGHDQNLSKIEKIEVTNLTRSFYQYELEVKGVNVKDKRTNTFRYTFDRAGFGFRISGYGIMNE